jgi:hypothetical protein
MRILRETALKRISHEVHAKAVAATILTRSVSEEGTRRTAGSAPEASLTLRVGSVNDCATAIARSDWFPVGESATDRSFPTGTPRAATSGERRMRPY